MTKSGERRRMLTAFTMASSRRRRLSSSTSSKTLLVCAFVSLIPACLAVNLESTTQLPAMTALKAATGFSWDLTLPCGSIAPSVIACDAAGYVTSLTLPMGTGGYIPNSIGLLTRMTALQAPNNLLSYSLPTGMGNLVSLQILDLKNNMFSFSLPSSMSSLTNLRRLDLSNNKFVGSVPLALQAMASLTYLNLADNYFFGNLSLPASLASGGAACNSRLFLDDNCLASGTPCTNSTLQRPADICAAACGMPVWDSPQTPRMCGGFGVCLPNGFNTWSVVTGWQCQCNFGYRYAANSNLVCVAIPPPPPPRPPPPPSPPPRPPPPRPPPPPCFGRCPARAQCVFLLSKKALGCSCLHYYRPVYRNGQLVRCDEPVA